MTPDHSHFVQKTPGSMKRELREHPVLQHAHLLLGMRENASEEQELKLVERASLNSTI